MTIEIPQNERGVVRLFALSMTGEEAQALKDNATAITEALRADAPLNADYVEVFPVSDLEGVGLAGYLTEGNAIPDAQIAPDRGKLDRLGGWVLIVYSQAFADAGVTLDPVPALTLIGTYGETRTDWSASETVEAEAAKPYSAPQETRKKPSDAAMSGRVATVALILLALFTALFIWMAG